MVRELNNNQGLSQIAKVEQVANRNFRSSFSGDDYHRDVKALMRFLACYFLVDCGPRTVPLRLTGID